VITAEVVCGCEVDGRFGDAHARRFADKTVASAFRSAAGVGQAWSMTTRPRRTPDPAQTSEPRPSSATARVERARETGGEPGLEYEEGTPYELYVGARTLHGMLRTVTDHPAEPAFLVISQVMELYFGLLRQEWTTARAQLRGDDLDGALSSLRRTVFHLEALNATWASLVWLTPREFNGFRDQLGEASGFQSYGYRHVEFALGLKTASVVRPHKAMAAVHADLLEGLAAPSVYDEVVALLARRGFDIPDEVLAADHSQEYVVSPAVEQAWAQVYREPRASDPLFMLAEVLTDIADEFTTWRHRHVMAVRRSMGAKPGSGGSSGLAWLERSLAKPVFPELWSARTLI
jgi:tryptophan 2,3-dioxygenase